MNWRTVLGLLFVLSLGANAVEGGDVMYEGGTITGVAAGSIGHLNTVSEKFLLFEGSGGKFEIPYASIRSFDYSQPVVRRLGVLPAIATGMLRHRQRRHLFRIEFDDPQGGAAQVVILEVPKQMPGVVQAVLEARAPQTHKSLCPICEKKSPAPSGNVLSETQNRVALPDAARNATSR